MDSSPYHWDGNKLSFLLSRNSIFSSNQSLRSTDCSQSMSCASVALRNHLPAVRVRLLLSERHCREERSTWGDGWGVRKGVLIHAILGARHCRRSVNRSQEGRPVSGCLWGPCFSTQQCFRNWKSRPTGRRSSYSPLGPHWWMKLVCLEWQHEGRAISTKREEECSSREHHGLTVMDVCWFRHLSAQAVPTHLECYNISVDSADTVVWELSH